MWQKLRLIVRLFHCRSATMICIPALGASWFGAGSPGERGAAWARSLARPTRSYRCRRRVGRARLDTRVGELFLCARSRDGGTDDCASVSRALARLLGWPRALVQTWDIQKSAMSSSVVPRRFMNGGGGGGGPSPPPRTHRHHSWDNHLGEKRSTVYKRVTRDGVITTHTTYDDANDFRKSKYTAPEGFVPLRLLWHPSRWRWCWWWSRLYALQN